MSGRIFITAAEPSGDALAAELIQGLRLRRPDLQFAGVGGERMQSLGINSPVNLTGLQTIGLFDGLRVMRQAKLLAQQTAEAAAAFRPDITILIDAWGFSLRVAQAIKALNAGGHVIKYIGPQVWASRPGRAAQLSRYVDELLCVFALEVPYYQPFNLPCTVVGYPPLSRQAFGDRAAMRRQLGVADHAPILLVLYGSRPREIKRMRSILDRTVAMLRRQTPELTVITVIAPEVTGLMAQQELSGFVVLGSEEKWNAFAAADVALCVSGTVTTEVALQQAAVVVVYKIDWLTWVIIRLGLLRTRYITLMNVVADQEVAPEYIQTRARPSIIGRTVSRLLMNSDARASQVKAQNQALIAMGRDEKSPTERAVDAVLESLDKLKVGG